MTIQTALNIRLIDHITLVVSNIQASREFYVGVLGLKEVPRPDFSFAGAWFASGNTQIHITLSDENSGLPGWADRQVGRVSRGHHFAFQVDDVRHAVKILAANAVEILDGPKKRPDGPEQIYFHDPDRHLVELFSLSD